MPGRFKLLPGAPGGTEMRKAEGTGERGRGVGHAGLQSHLRSGLLRVMWGIIRGFRAAEGTGSDLGLQGTSSGCGERDCGVHGESREPREGDLLQRGVGRGGGKCSESPSVVERWRSGATEERVASVEMASARARSPSGSASGTSSRIHPCTCVR